MKEIKFDFNNMFSFNIGPEHGVQDFDIRQIFVNVNNASQHLNDLIKDSRNRIALSLEWTKLPFQGKDAINQVRALAAEITRKYQSVIMLGIGGSYLGLRAAQDALVQPYYNEFDSLRKNKPKVYFEGNNLDPDTLHVLLKNLNPKKTFVVVISKSGETTETKAAFMVVEDWLRKNVGLKYGRQIVAITDPESGSLRKRVIQEQQKDKLSFRSLPLLKGVGGRYSEFNMGLLHLAIVGVDIQAMLDGAKDMAIRCARQDLSANPAYMYATLNTILSLNKGKTISILMPFSEKLKSTADWYCQLLAESVGKKFKRKIEIKDDARELWHEDTSSVANMGRTPVACRGTNDLHSIQQNNIEGRNDKIITFIRVEKFDHDIVVPGKNDILAKKKFSSLMQLAQEATEWSLVRESRPNTSIIMPAITPYYWGGLIFFLEMATAFEGELLNINAFDQPGVEGYKHYMYYKLGKSGVPAEVAAEIKNKPLLKKPEFII